MSYTRNTVLHARGNVTLAVGNVRGNVILCAVFCISRGIYRETNQTEI